jgi:lipopolysaccharide export system permease protein
VRIFDRYVLRQYLPALLLALLAFISIFLVVDFIEKLNRFLDHDAAFWAVTRYFAWKTPYVIVMMLPVALLMATFLTLGQMARFHELSAIVTSGASLARVALPVLLVATLASAASFVLGELVVPQATTRRERILEREIDKIPPAPEAERTDVTVRGRGGYVYVVRLYLVPERRMHDVSIYNYEGGRLRRRVDARVGEWKGDAWLLRQGTERRFQPDGTERSRSFERMRLVAAEGPEQFGSPPDDPDQLGYFDLRRFLRRAGPHGAELTRYRVDLHVKLAFPLANLIVGIIGCVLAMQARHPTPALSFGLSVSIAFAYFGVMRMCEALGDGGLLAPWAAGWAPVCVFGGWAAYLLHRLHRR